jgi:23S rRNA (adenine2503-C2)-methyltransferase
VTSVKLDVPVNLVGRTSSEIEMLVAGSVDRPFRGRQIARWVIDNNATSFDEMTNLSLELRRKLAGRFVVRDPEVLDRLVSRDGSVKYLFSLIGGARVEGVAIHEGRKVTMCLSSQSGCAVGCTFCVTGALGAGRNLESDEIVGQYRVMLRHLGDDIERVNLVFMGMGEPLLNTKNLGRALDVLAERVSLKRITVSTAGIIPGIAWLAALDRRPKLAISLNAPDQERRQQIMPVARRYPLTDLFSALRSFPLERGRRITFEYVVIAGFNDALDDARRVRELIRGIPSKVNVIPLNEDLEEFPELRRPAADQVDAFASALRDAGVTATVRWSRGGDVAAACGQLRGRHALDGR